MNVRQERKRKKRKKERRNKERRKKWKGERKTYIWDKGKSKTKHFCWEISTTQKTSDPKT